MSSIVKQQETKQSSTIRMTTVRMFERIFSISTDNQIADNEHEHDINQIASDEEDNSLLRISKPNRLRIGSSVDQSMSYLGKQRLSLNAIKTKDELIQVDVQEVLPTVCVSISSGSLHVDEVVDCFVIKDAQPGSLKNSIICAKFRVTDDRVKNRIQFFNLDHINVGFLLELMDAFTADVALRHAKFDKDYDGKIVTVTLISMSFGNNKNFSYEHDLYIQSCVTRVGRSSIEVLIEITNGESSVEAAFVLASRNASMTAALPVSPLLTTTAIEERIIRISEERRIDQEMQQEMFDVEHPNSVLESAILHELLTQEKIKPFQYMEDTKITTTLLMHRTNTNINKQIFGGYLTKVAYDTAWICGFDFSGYFPVLQKVEKINFLQAISVGSIIIFESRIVYSNTKFVLVNTDAYQVIPNADKNNSVKTKVVEFVFLFEFSGKSCSRVYPKDYPSAIKYLTGRRTLVGLRKQLYRIFPLDEDDELIRKLSSSLKLATANENKTE